MLKAIKIKTDSSFYQLSVMSIISQGVLSCNDLNSCKNFIQHGIDNLPRANIAKANGSYKVCFTDDSQKVLQVIHKLKNEKVFATITE